MYVFASIFAALGVLLLLLALVLLLLRHKSQLIFGIYPAKGLFYQLKYGIALVVLKHLRHKFYHSKDEWNAPAFLAQMDRPQTLSDNPQSYDVVSFMGANAQGQKLMVTLERRRRGVIKAGLFVWLPGEGLYCSPKLPDMVYFTTDGVRENEEFKGAGFHIEPAQSMRQWRIRYEGELRRIAAGTGGTTPTTPTNPTLESDKQLTATVRLELQFNAKSAAYFNYNRDLSAAVIADSVARESWNDAFYNMLKHVDQMLEQRMHYEQSGTLTGLLQLDGRTVALQLNGFRDHSFGTERCLSSINRYVYFALFLGDGTSMVVGNLSQPSFFLSSLKVGYVCTPAGVYQPITSCNFELYTYGEKGTPPRHQNFIVKTAEAKYFVQINAEEMAMRYVGADWQSKVYQQFVACTVNGVPGQGIAEFLYRNKQCGRPESVSGDDPEWFKRVRQFERSLSTGQHKDDEVFIF